MIRSIGIFAGCLLWGWLLWGWLLWTMPAFALPPPDDPPEEILRTEIITEARSPVNGEPVSPGEYARLQEELSDRGTPIISRRVSNIVRQLRIRQAIRSIFPFLLR